MIESDADRAAFLADFGVTATYRLAAGGTSTLVGLFDRSPRDVTVGGIVATLDARPSFLVWTVDLPAGAAQDAGDQLTVPAQAHTGLAETTYDVTRIEPDGTGMVLLMLGR